MCGGGGVVCSLFRACGIRISKVKKRRRFFIKECCCFEKGWGSKKIEALLLLFFCCSSQQCLGILVKSLGIMSCFCFVFVF